MIVLGEWSKNRYGFTGQVGAKYCGAGFSIVNAWGDNSRDGSLPTIVVHPDEVMSIPLDIARILLLAGPASLACILIVFLWKKWLSHDENPFKEDFVRSPGPIELDKKKRDRILKYGFKPDRIPVNLDAIVIGSGMGGLVTAGCLARVGKRVLVLEQHDRAGGCTHTFEEKGYEFDVGLHYIGEMEIGSMNQTMMDVLSDGQLVWEPMDPEFDAIAYYSEGHCKLFKYKAGKGDYENRLLEYFPGEENAVKKFMALQKRGHRAMAGYIFLKRWPKWLLKIFQATGIYNLLFSYDNLLKRSLREELDTYTQNKELKLMFSYCFGDFGTVPSKASNILSGALMNHFYYGAYYPRGGSSEIAYNMIPGIERAGGAVLVRASVQQVLFSGNTASGVRVIHGDQTYDIQAPIVISDAGLINTYQKLIPKNILTNFGLQHICEEVDLGWGGFQLLVGLKGTSKELGLKSRNYWIYNDIDCERKLEECYSMSKEEAANAVSPITFLSFPSAKDSTWEARHPGKSVCVVVTFAKYEWFEDWKDERVMKRGPVYNDLKRAFQEQLWNMVLKLFPRLKDKVEYMDSGTPLSHQYYIGSPKGEIYGIDHTRKRFEYEMGMSLRPKTKIPGLFLTGQDVMTCGVSGAMIGGLIAAEVITGKDYFSSLIWLMAQRKMFAKKKLD